ncbi:MAG TPA: tetratricopeptide repeat protein [Candidatus Acidoferrum sp.]|nr:tetratricopeptide repeat protein [Candidatus Acidoferrum sp.]
MNPHLSRALLLIEQNRHELAEQELRQALADEPQEAYAHALLAQCLAARELFPDATAEIQQAIHLAPDFAFAHYVHARILYDRNHHDEALLAIREAIRLDPEDADYCALLAAIHFDDKRWQQTLESSERGLQNNPEHIGCTNIRAMALQKLGRSNEAQSTIESALSKNPESALTHANQGWALLRSGKSKEALGHFKEALRLDPENEWARAGIVEALKARNFIYAIFLKYFFFMSRLSSNMQWGVIVGGYIGNRILAGVARSNPDIAPWVLPLRILYIAFVILTWTAQPLFNLLLRLNRFGRLALSREQIVASNWVGATVALALVFLLGVFVTPFAMTCSLAALVFGGLIIPIAGTFSCNSGWPRKVMAAYTISMAAVGLVSITLGLVGEKGASTALIGAYLIGLFLSGWIANYLSMQRPKR